LLSVAQQIKQIEQEKKDNFKQADDLMKQADKAESNEEANRLNDRAIALKVTNSKLSCASDSSTAQPRAVARHEKGRPQS